MEHSIVGGRYELGAAIGSGGFGTVFRARDLQTETEVAVKLVRAGLGSKFAAEQLEHEAALLRGITSRRIAGVLDAGSDAAGAWLVTELVEGAPLTLATLGRPLLPHEVLRVARSLLEGLAAAHRALVVHGDVKPSNVLVPRGDDALDEVKLVDFGLARSARAPHDATGFGTARYLAPEVLAGREPTPQSDLYGAGLVLFELLGIGPLHPGAPRAQVAARLAGEPSFTGRVPEPLASVFTSLLATDPSRRWQNAVEAHEAVIDLDTAPVATLARPTVAPRTSMLPPRPASAPPEPELRLTRLPFDPVAALRETLRHLDLPMLDALARRERSNAFGRIARAVALALRLELDAAALILEPLASQNDLARAIGACLLAPRGRQVTRARVDADREDRWLDAIDPDLAGMLVAVSAALSLAEDAPRDVERSARALARLDVHSTDAGLPFTFDATRATLGMVSAAARFRTGESALERALPALGGPQAESPLAFHAVVRALLAASVTNEGAGFALGASNALRLEQAERIAAQSGTTLLDAASATALGVLLSAFDPTDPRGPSALDRAATLLAHGDAPSLEFDAELARCAIAVRRGRFIEALAHLRSARDAAHAERAGERELVATSLGVVAELATGDVHAAYASAAILDDGRLAIASAHVSALGWVARALVALSASDRDSADDALASAEARVREVDASSAEAFVIVETLGLVLDAARDVDTSTTRLERHAAAHAFRGFYMLDLLGAVVDRLPEDVAPEKMRAVLGRIRSILLQASARARSIETDLE